MRYMSDKLVINQIDPTTRCGNMCNHCGEDSRINGVDLPVKDIRTLLESGIFEIENVIGFRKKLLLCGGGDPTYYSDFAELLVTLSKFVSDIVISTGGMNPDIIVKDLLDIKEKINKTKIHAHVTHHPFGNNGYEQMIMSTLERLTGAEIETRLRVLCPPEYTIDKIEPEEIELFPFLNFEGYKNTEIYRSIVQNFQPEEIRQLGGLTFFDTLKKDDEEPLLTIIYEKRTIQNSGRARKLPALMRSEKTSQHDVQRFLKEIEEKGIYHKIRVTAQGFITACPSALSKRREMQEGDLYGHSYEEIVSNRLLFLSHLEETCKRWMQEYKEKYWEDGMLCDTICRRARKAFSKDKKRIPSHRGKGKTILKARVA